jgi:hypothetical protein
MNAIGFFRAAYDYGGQLRGEPYVLKTPDSYKKLVISDGILKGYILWARCPRGNLYLPHQGEDAS